MRSHVSAVLWAIILTAGSVCAQDSTPGISLATPDAAPDNTAARKPPIPNLSPTELPGGRIGLVRGVVKRMDPIHDQMLVHAFGGGDLTIAFDPRTSLLPENSNMHLTSLPIGAVVSVDTAMENGKLFARSIRTGQSGNGAVELNGKIVRYDADKSRLILRDSINPKNISLKLTSGTVITNRGHATTAQELSSDMLIRVWFSPGQQTANNIEILAKRGDSFVFEGRVIGMDLRTRTVAISNDTDQSVRELALGSLDSTALGLLREGAYVNIQAVFDGDRYNVHRVMLVTSKQ
jgi:hypothetical protein